jgi:predicted nucleic acid-binding protein
MILRKLTANLKTQNWTAVGIDFLIVVLGVFVGVQASNWNQARIERAETQRLLMRIEPEIDQIITFAANARDYYATSRRYAETALAAWNGDATISDNDFVIAAYQASQIHGLNESQSWAAVFGADELRNVDDDRLRIPLARLMAFDVENLNSNAVASRYREDVRMVIPDAVQQAIRKTCGDRLKSTETFDFALPHSCSLKLDPALAGQVAADLRGHPELARELRLHLALVSSFLNSLTQYEQEAQIVRQRIAASNR